MTTTAPANRGGCHSHREGCTCGPCQPRRYVYVEEVEFLRSCGIGDVQIIAQLGTTAEALAQGLLRAGRADLAQPFWRMLWASRSRRAA